MKSVYGKIYASRQRDSFYLNRLLRPVAIFQLNMHQNAVDNISTVPKRKRQKGDTL